MSQIPPIGKDPSRSTVPIRGEAGRVPVSAPRTQPTVATPAAAPISWKDPSQRAPLMMLGGIVALLVVAYWDMFSLTSAAWSEGLYSHGWIVPLFAVALLWLRWEPFVEVPTVERWIGLALLAIGL